MTVKQQEQYDRALAIVERSGLQVVAHGTRKSDGAAVYCVPSRSEANRWHLVVVAHGALWCDCTAAQFNRYCCHRAAVRQRLEAEASASRSSDTDEAMSWWLKGGEWA